MFAFLHDCSFGHVGTFNARKETSLASRFASVTFELEEGYQLDQCGHEAAYLFASARIAGRVGAGRSFIWWHRGALNTLDFITFPISTPKCHKHGVQCSTLRETPIRVETHGAERGKVDESEQFAGSISKAQYGYY